MAFLHDHFHEIANADGLVRLEELRGALTTHAADAPVINFIMRHIDQWGHEIGEHVDVSANLMGVAVVPSIVKLYAIAESDFRKTSVA